MYLGVEHKIKVISTTAIVVLIILAILLWVHFRTPIPPYPEDGGQGMGIEISLGYGEPMEETTTAMERSTQITEEPEQLITQDYEDADAIPETKPSKILKNTNKKNIEDKKIEKQPELNEKALFKKRNQGETNEGSGNYGISGQRGSGIGSGDGTGKGTGVGTGIGDGISFSLEGRNPLTLIKPRGDFQTSGKVVVEITVDQNGNVISAVPGVKGSTTLDEYLLHIAREAALASKFNPDPKSTIQKGTITYRFVLQ